MYGCLGLGRKIAVSSANNREGDGDKRGEWVPVLSSRGDKDTRDLISMSEAMSSIEAAGSLKDPLTGACKDDPIAGARKDDPVEGACKDPVAGACNEPAAGTCKDPAAGTCKEPAAGACRRDVFTFALVDDVVADRSDLI
mmetsp:Transcript_100142/g.188644  ORF Transcript_100142/g.188644 Transcript_100142/m.188644 type:complete len:140 (-) Transcript_100142:178-597(-)